MSDEIAFDRSATTEAGTVASLSPLVRRIIAGNSGPMTFPGTCSYIVGQGTVAYAASCTIKMLCRCANSISSSKNSSVAAVPVGLFG